MTKNQSPKSRTKDLVVQELNREILIYDLFSDKAFCLNETSSLVWQSCDGTKSVSEIGQIVSRKLNSNVPDELIWLALINLKEENLLEENSEFENNFRKVSRREIIKKAGYATMIALPLITSIIAPASVQARSGAPVVVPQCDPLAVCCPANTQTGATGNSAANCLANARAECCSGNGTQLGPGGGFFGNFLCVVICD